VPSAKFTSFHDSLRYALTGEKTGDVIGSGVWE
jgi:hypothetical protein